jgi:cold shock protein
MSKHFKTPVPAGWAAQQRQSEPKTDEEWQMGRVIRYDTERGYGWISPAAGGVDVHVGKNAVVSAGLKELAEGDVVSYVVRTEGRPSARALRIVG